MTAAYFEEHPTDPDKVIMRKPHHPIQSDKERILQLIKELRPAIKPLDNLGSGKTTNEWFDILVKEIEEKI
jgi:hypothetical protein